MPPKFAMPRFSKEDMDAVEGLNLKQGKPSWGDLDNPVHPLLVKLETGHPHMMPSLRLASRYIDEDQFLPFWRALIFSEVKKEQAPSLGAEVRRITPKESLTPEEIQLTREGLLKAARFITDFEFGYPEGEKVRNLLGCT